MNISGSFELVETTGTFPSVSSATISPTDLLVRSEQSSSAEESDPADKETASLEIRKPLDLLGADLQLVITPSNQKLNLEEIYLQITENVVPIFTYIIDQDRLSESDIEELRLFRSIIHNEPILFIRLDPLDA